jgi:hypothetical protein
MRDLPLSASFLDTGETRRIEEEKPEMVQIPDLPYVTRAPVEKGKTVEVSRDIDSDEEMESRGRSRSRSRTRSRSGNRK